MKPFIADFHVHSRFSRATSRNLDPEHLDLWSRLKGITLIGTGDFTHPGWLRELKEKLEPAEPGLFRLKAQYRLSPPLPLSWIGERQVRFILSGEISTIYKKKDRVRKVHHLILAPGWAAVEAMQRRLSAIGGNITSDGRPILGMDSRNLLELALDASAGEAMLIPAHIWTPWFSILGDKSGFETITECYEDLTMHISAVETGLSSDPPMNRRCRQLDGLTLVSNSDAHSPERIGREANLFETELSYPAIVEALRSGDPDRFRGTLEFFPQEGKYHFDGHRKCGIRLHPEDTEANEGKCPICGKAVTIGVMHRVMKLSDRIDSGEGSVRHPFYSLIPLREILAEILGTRPESKKVNALYLSLLAELGPELEILRYVDLPDVRSRAGELLAEALMRMRERRVIIEEGYDGEYGRIRLFSQGEINDLPGKKRAKLTK